MAIPLPDSERTTAGRKVSTSLEVAFGGIHAKALKTAQPCSGNIRISKSPAQRAIVFPPAPETTGNARIPYTALSRLKLAQKSDHRATGSVHLEKSIAPCISLAGIEQ
jgi:hypothetical protein